MRSLVAVLLATCLGTAEAAAEPSWIKLPSLRVGAGASVSSDSGDRVAAAADVSGGLRLYKTGDSGPFAHLELGYVYADNIASPHSLSAGSGLGYRLGTVGLSLTPRLVVGLSESAIGTRPGLAIDLVGVAYAEVSYQYLPDPAGADHSVRATAGIDIGLLLHILLSPLEMPHPSSP